MMSHSEHHSVGGRPRSASNSCAQLLSLGASGGGVVQELVFRFRQGPEAGLPATGRTRMFLQRDRGPSLDRNAIRLLSGQQCNCNEHGGVMELCGLG